MKVLLVAAVAVAISGAAFAKDLKQDQTTVPAMKAQVMNDAEMDKVTAAGGFTPEVVENSGKGFNINSNPVGAFNAGHNGGGFQGNGSSAATFACCK